MRPRWPVLGRIKRSPDVVTHPAVDCYVETARTAVQRDGLDCADAVEGERARTTDRATRLYGEVRDGYVEC